jgi:inorganic triphosphatase YgiF
MEIEAKYRVAGTGIFQEVLGLGSIGPFQLTPDDQIEAQHNTYFDTTDGQLRAQRYGLRIRDLGNRRIATLKGEARINDGLFERDEWEAEIGDDDRPEHWPAGELRDRVLALVGSGPLVPLLTIDVQRRHVYAAHAGARFAEVSLDQGTILAGGRTEPICELEIELLKGGDRADFEALTRLLRERFNLQPDNRSKLARGLALLSNVSQGDRVTG